MLDCGQIGELLSGYLDGQLTQGDRQRVELHLEDCAKCRRTYQQMADLRQATAELTFGEVTHEEWSKIMNDVTVRTSRSAGWLLFVVGTLLVCGYGAYQFAVDNTVPALVKTGVAGLVVGTILLFLSVLRQRVIARKTDKYKDVRI